VLASTAVHGQLEIEMTQIEVEFRYETGLSSSPFVAAVLTGSWTPEGLPSSGPWSTSPMAPICCEDGSPGFVARVGFDPDATEELFAWGVQLHREDESIAWGIFAETPWSSMQHRSFVLPRAADQTHRESYRLSWHRARGAHRWSTNEGQANAIRFSCWAPNALAVNVVFGGPSGYIADDGYGRDPELAPLAMSPSRHDPEVWEVVAASFDAFVGRRYMFEVVRDDGTINFATDMFSRRQCGEGYEEPAGYHYEGAASQLNGRPSCSEVVDLNLIGSSLGPAGHQSQAELDFWADEHPDRDIPRSVSDLVIYELHIGALNPTTNVAGTFADAIALLPYLDDLGINAIELMPMLQFDGTASWGYGSSQLLAIQASAGGRDGLRHFVKACHQRGIAVIMDVVYNHYAYEADRSAWQYDSTRADKNIYYWYEGAQRNHADANDGYIDNGSSGWAPRYCDEHVRALFVASAVSLLDEFHIDGLRVDQTTTIHRDNHLSRDGAVVSTANIYGRKFLRELCQTLKTVWPESLLIAEDHSPWPAITEPAATGGVGFDATWYVDFFHQLVGKQTGGEQWATLLWSAGKDQDAPLRMGDFAGALATSARRRVVYEESHDEAGGHDGTRRTILAAVNGFPLVGATREFAEARCRFACAMSMLSAGTPMFLMGEEIGAQKDFTHNTFRDNKEDLEAERLGDGARLFRFYQDVIALRLSNEALRSSNIEILHTNDDARVIAFRRWKDRELIVVGSLNNAPFDQPHYRIEHHAISQGAWSELLNSDANLYAGAGVGNPVSLHSDAGGLEVVLPANGVVVLEREPAAADGKRSPGSGRDSAADRAGD
jgi:1,4-alpha-glucan branching enzyme